jgi:predicted  nucleic acid-binding Zn-ribbon protein
MTKQSPKPIDVAMNEIKVLKAVIVDLRAEMSNLKKEIAPVKQDLAERKKKELDEEQSYEKVKTMGWWYY